MKKFIILFIAILAVLTDYLYANEKGASPIIHRGDPGHLIIGFNEPCSTLDTYRVLYEYLSSVKNKPNIIILSGTHGTPEGDFGGRRLKEGDFYLEDFDAANYYKDYAGSILVHDISRSSQKDANLDIVKYGSYNGVKYDLVLLAFCYSDETLYSNLVSHYKPARNAFPHTTYFN
ncbi:hypothetical protein [Francisella philomiragia]|uniref:hypothetical protein n=1 Tax=Francisella philomiragia TaxID=28110 RepID=UPI003518D918